MSDQLQTSYSGKDRSKRRSARPKVGNGLPKGRTQKLLVENPVDFSVSASYREEVVDEREDTNGINRWHLLEKIPVTLPFGASFPYNI
ncbi:MAG: hypothetical protein ABSE79_20120 [Terriglobia bacterium]|jgi:hypothetical protein